MAAKGGGPILGTTATGDALHELVEILEVVGVGLDCRKVPKVSKAQGTLPMGNTPAGEGKGAGGASDLAMRCQV